MWDTRDHTEAKGSVALLPPSEVDRKREDQLKLQGECKVQAASLLQRVVWDLQGEDARAGGCRNPGNTWVRDPSGACWVCCEEHLLHALSNVEGSILEDSLVLASDK